MLFNSHAFAVFFPVVLLLYYVLRHRGQNILLLLASYVFYGWWNYKFLALLWLSTGVDFFIAARLDAINAPRARRRLMALSVGLNLLYLGVFKYFNFFSDSFASALEAIGLHADLPTMKVILPVGISFYTLQSISYIVDVYRRERAHEKDFLAYAVYISYFPHLLAGPIQRSWQLIPQILRPRRVNAKGVRTGVLLMLVGYFKKVAVADAVAPIVDAIFSSHPHVPAVWPRATLLGGAFLFLLQVYCDFSGYSDIARGVSRLLGIELSINFAQPLLAPNMTEFWRSWNISVAQWLRDYIYIPLGGNRVGRWRTHRNIMATMLLGGFWHGASWKFVFWGGLNGLALLVHKYFLDVRTLYCGETSLNRAKGRVAQLGGILLTLVVESLIMVFFRAPSLSDGLKYLLGIAISSVSSVGESLFSRPWQTGVIGFYILAVFILDALTRARDDRELPFASSWPYPLRGLAYGALVSMCLWVGLSGDKSAHFIYFQF